MEPARGSAATTVTGRFRQWLAGWGLTEWRRAALVTVLVATAAFGGLDTVNDKVTDLKPGEQFNTGEFEMTVHRATLVNEVRAGKKVLYAAKPGTRYLGLIITAHNIGTLPGVLDKPVQLVGLPAATMLPAMRVADGTQAGRLGPGLTDQVALLWEVPESALSVGAELPVRLWKETRRLNVTAGQGWVLTDYYGQLTVPVGGPQ